MVAHSAFVHYVSTVATYICTVPLKLIAHFYREKKDVYIYIRL